MDELVRERHPLVVSGTTTDTLEKTLGSFYAIHLSYSLHYHHGKKHLPYLLVFI